MGQWSSIRSSVTQANPIICQACGLEPLLFKTHVFPPSFDNKSHDQTVGFSLNITMESSSYSFPGFTHSVMSDSLWPHGLQRSRPPCPSPTPGVHLNSCPLSQWCHLTISSSAALFSFWLQPFAASRSFPMSWLFTSGSRSIGVSISASVLPMNIQDWILLGLTRLISLQSKGLSRVFSIMTIQKHQFFGIQLSF